MDSAIIDRGFTIVLCLILQCIEDCILNLAHIIAFASYDGDDKSSCFHIIY